MQHAVEQVIGREAKTAILYELASLTRSCVLPVFAHVNSIVMLLSIENQRCLK